MNLCKTKTPRHTQPQAKRKNNLKNIFKKSVLAALISFTNNAQSTDIVGSVALEGLTFFQDAQQTEQKNAYGSVLFEPEFFTPIGKNSEFSAQLFYRKDFQSESRTHGDIRELMLYRYADDWEFNVGIGKVFWGVTESRHLVDVINQTDNIESLDDEQRLGQPMAQFKLIRDWGTLDFFVLPYFRELDFGDNDLRPNLGLKVSDANYQDSAKQRHIDIAARWSHTFDDLDFAMSYFNGTQRTPLLNPVLENQQLVLQPTYVQTQQLGLEAQYIYQDWLLKFEGLHRASYELANTAGPAAQNKYQKKRSNAVVAGFEYTFYGVQESAHDIGLIGEYLFDGWQELTPFQKDWLTGVRWVWNDVQGTELLLGHIFDVDDGTQIWQLEGSRRLDEVWKGSIMARWATDVDAENDFSALLKNQDQISAKIEYFF